MSSSAQEQAGEPWRLEWRRPEGYAYDVPFLVGAIGNDHIAVQATSASQAVEGAAYYLNALAHEARIALEGERRGREEAEARLRSGVRLIDEAHYVLIGTGLGTRAPDITLPGRPGTWRDDWCNRAEGFTENAAAALTNHESEGHEHCWYYANMTMHYVCRTCGEQRHRKPAGWSDEHDSLAHRNSCVHLTNHESEGRSNG